MTKPVNVTDATFNQEVLQASELVLVDFWADWCGPCKAVAPILEEIASEQAGSIKIAKVDIDENQQYAAQLNVTSIPTMVVFKNGQPIDKIIGAMPKQQIMSRVQPHLAAATA